MERQAKDGTYYTQVGEDKWQEVTRTAKDGTVYKKVGEDKWSPKNFDTADYSPENIEATKNRSAENAKSLGSKIWDNVVDPAMTVLDYFPAIGRQIVAAPAKAARGDFVGAVADPFIQVASSPKSAPTGQQVAEMYGVPQSRQVSPAAVGNPLMASTYEMYPDEDDPSNQTIYPSAHAGALLDAAVGAQSINAAAKGIGKIGQGVSSGAKKVAEITSPANPKVNTEQILEASRKLGVQITPAMLDNSKFVERLEYTLANSPSIWGQSIARKQEAVKNALQRTVKEFTKDASTLSKNEIGEQFKAGMTANVAERLDPISESFNEIAQNTKAVPIPQRAKDAVIRNIKNIDAYRLTKGAGKPGQYVEMIESAENANDVKQIMSFINEDLKQATGAEKFVLSGIKSKLSSMEKNSITRAAVQTARDMGQKGDAGKKVGSDLIKDLQAARGGYRDLSEDLKSVSESARIRSKSGPISALDEIEKIPSENIQAKFFNTNNNRQLKSLSEKFPEQFELLRQGKLRDIADAAIDHSLKGKGEASTAKFLKEVRSLTPESKKMLFGSNTDVIDDLETIQKTLPENFNPSGTANQMGWRDALAKNVQDIPNYVLYRAATSNLGKKVSEGARKGLESASKLPELSDRAKQAPILTGKLSADAKQLTEGQRALLVAQNEKKGSDKWANRGMEKIQQFDSSISKELLEEIKSDKKGKMLLIQASETTPGSKAFENVMKKIRTGYLNKGDQ